MFQLEFLTKEHDLNKIIGLQKRKKNNLSILFISEWCEFTDVLISSLKNTYGDSDTGEVLYVVNSFDMPHSFVIYGSTKVPHLVRLRKDKVRSEFYLPNIYKQLKVS